LDIKELKSFCMVARLGSFSKASEALGLGQPAVTKHVQRLEAELGRELLERGQRPLKLTAAGTNLFRMAEPLVEGLETLSSRGPLLATAPVTIAVPHGLIGYVLPEAVFALREVIPSARVRIRSGTKEEVFELVQAGRVDFALAPDPGKSRHFQFEPLFSSDRVVMTPPGHPFLARAPRSLKEVAGYPLIFTRFQTRTRALLEAEFRRLDVPFEVAVELDSPELLERYIERGVGIAVGLRGALLAKPKTSVGIVSLSPLLPPEMIGIVNNPLRSLSDTAEEFMRQLRSTVGAGTGARPSPNPDSPAERARNRR
jgi:DNA-binding transcriptional LysR family regulator